MHCLLRIVTLLPVVGALAALDPGQRLGPLNSTVRAPKKFIVELGIGESVTDVSAKITASGGKVLLTYESDVFTGLSIESATDNTDSLEQIEAVARAWPVGRITLSPVTPQTFSDDASAANYSVHQYTGVDKAHAAGFRGKGATVAIVDTGVDYKHPALGGGFGPGFKIEGGYDLVGDGNWPIGEKEPDADPMDRQGHGTHVTGIIAGETASFVGVAPDAKIRMYKVFSTLDSTDEDTLIDAFLEAYKDGADVITASIGGYGGFTDDPWAVVASRLVDAGVVVTIAAGNNGDDGVFYGSNGATGKNVVTVASMDPTVRAAKPFQATFTLNGVSNTTAVAYLPQNQDPAWEIPAGTPIIPLSFNTSDPAQACSPLPADTPDLSGGIVLVRRGGCSFSVKQASLEAFGAKYILFYNNNQTLAFPITPDTKSLSASIEADAGAAIIKTVQAGGNVTAYFTAYPGWAVSISNSAGGVPSYFTSWGGSYELNIKPDIAAPGANIYSTFFLEQWAILSGTSMATPYIAGIAALYIGAYGGREVHGNGIAKRISDRIISSGRALPWQTEAPTGVPIDYGYLAPVVQVGTGLVDAWNVLNVTTQLAFEPFALNDTGHFSRYHQVDITNTGSSPITYNFTIQPAGGFNAQSSHQSFLAALTEISPKTYIPTVSFPSGTFTVEAGETKTAHFNFEPPTGYDVELLPIYSGKIIISGDNGDQLSVPYMGAAFDLKKELRNRVFSDPTPYQASGAKRVGIDDFHVYDFNLSLAAQSFPKVYVELKWGSTELRWDIYEANWPESNWEYPPVVGEKGYIGSATTFAESDRYWWYDPRVMDRENVLALPAYDIWRTTAYTYNDESFWWLGKLANGSYIAPGNYTFRFAALVPFSDPQHSDNWDIWTTPQITVLPYTV